MPKIMPDGNVTLPIDRKYYQGKVNIVKNADEARGMVELAQQLELLCIGIDGTFSCKPLLAVDKDLVYDICSIRPESLALTFAELYGGKYELYRFLVNLRDPGVLLAVQTLLHLPVSFVGYRLKNLLFCLWSCGLQEPEKVWDAEIFERGASLGKINVKRRVQESHVLDMGLEARLVSHKTYELSLSRLCQRYQVDFRGDLDRSPIEKQPSEDSRVAMERAVVAPVLYFRQVSRGREQGILEHMIRLEMPWVVTNARMEWTGVRVDPDRRRKILDALQVHWPARQQALAREGIANVNSDEDLKAYFQKKGLLYLFRSGGGCSFKKDTLKEYKHLQEVALVYEARQISDLKAEKILNPKLAGADGRVHPQHRQLSAETGRQAAKYPNILGLSRLLRTVIVPEPGNGIGEVDLSQIEVGIAAAVFRDEALIQAFNTGDVYSDMAKRFYVSDLSREDLALEGRDFKIRHPEKRDLLKTCTLSLIYGGTERAMAERLRVTTAQAREIRDGFLEMFPGIAQAMAQGTSLALYRGYIYLVSGLKIYLDNELSSPAKRRLALNYPIQGSAAVVFKAAGNRLDRLYRQFSARLLIPLHDSYIFEAPLEDLREVAELTRRVMCETVAEFFPVLRPRAEENIKHPHCWNKEGDSNAFDRWILNGEL